MKEAITMSNIQKLEDLVRKGLSSILGFEEIRNSQVLSRFIEFVVEKKLSGHEDEIKEYTIAVKGLGKPSDFNPQLDASVRIHAGRLRRILTQYYQKTGKNDVVLIDIPKGSYVPVFINRNKTNGEAVEIAPGPVQKENPVEKTEQEVKVQKKPVLAVLPFHNLSPENSRDYFVAGIGEQISTDLVRFENVSVISYFYNAEIKDLHEIKDKANIDYVLTGSVRIMNDVMKLNVHLILAENGMIVFTETHTRRLTPDNIFDIQDEIVGKILNVIADDNGIIIMSKAHSSPFNKPEHMSVQEAIYKYFDFTWDYSPEKFQVAIHSLQKAVETEPDNPLALALLSGLYMDAYITDLTPDLVLLEKAVDLAQSAVKLDPHCQHAQKALAWAFLLLWKKEKSMEAIERCINLNPKASSIISTMALAYVCQGEFNRGFKWLLESIHLNPVTTISAKLSFGLFYFHKGDYEECGKWLERLLPIETPFIKLLQLALYGKLHKNKKSDIGEDILALEDHVVSIVGRKLSDETLKNQILDGLKLAGLTVKR